MPRPPFPPGGPHGKWAARWEARHGDAEFWMNGPPPWRPPKALTLWLPVVLSLALQLPAAIWISTHSQLEPIRAAVVIALAVIGPLALIAGRRLPGPVVAVVSIAASADLFANTSGGPPYVALSFALIGAIVRGARVWAFASIAVAWAATVVVGLTLGYDWPPGRIAAVTIGLLIVLGIGEGLRTRRDRYQQLRERWTRRQQTEVQAERVRIARELHDVLAHSLSQINVQAGVGLHLMDKQPQKAADALASIKETSKTALEEVRSVLGVLRAEDGADPAAPLLPEPDLSRLPRLAASMAEHDLQVTVHDGVGERAPKPVQLAVFRIVQEALTNVVRHSTATAVEVNLREEAGTYRLRVADDGRPRHDRADGDGGGRGLLGMRERAELLGGTLHAAGSDAGWTVDAHIPVPEYLTRRREGS